MSEYLDQNFKENKIKSITSFNPLLCEDYEDLSSLTKDLWNNLSQTSFQNSLMITGGTGVFGKWILESWSDHIDRGFKAPKLILLSRNPGRFLESMPHLKSNIAKHVEWLTGDIKNFNSKNHKAPFIIHGATEASHKLNIENPNEMLNTIVDGAHKIFDFAKNASCKRLLFLSSGAVYGHQPKDISHVLEDYLGAPDPFKTGSAYGEGKRLTELLGSIESKKYGYDFISTRGYAFSGAHLPLDIHFAIGNFVRDGLLKKDILIQGDGTPKRSYLHGTDIVQWILKFLIYGKNNNAYNLGSDQEVSIEDLAHKVAKHFGVGVKVLSQSNGGADHVPSIQKAKNELGLKVNVSLDESILRMKKWWEGHLK